ncbi:MAG: MerR family transcriptional regulator, partial [Burkholderiaceae bacterium]
LLYNQGFTISGARNRLDDGVPAENGGNSEALTPQALRTELTSIISLLRV